MTSVKAAGYVPRNEVNPVVKTQLNVLSDIGLKRLLYKDRGRSNMLWVTCLKENPLFKGSSYRISFPI